MSRSRKQRSPLTAIENFLLSGAAQIVSKTVAAPFESLKLVRQLCKTLSEIEDIPSYVSDPSKFDILLLYQIIQHKGILFLFSGNLYNCLKYFPTSAISFMFKNRIMQSFKVPINASPLRKIFTNILAGGVAGSLTMLFVYPMDTIRTIYGCDINGTMKNNLSWTQLYSGIPISCFGIFVYRGLYFGLYNFCRPMLSQNSSFVTRFVMGYTVTVSAGLLSYPIDTIRRRQMLTNENLYDAVMNLGNKHGWLSLFDGSMTNIYRGILGAACLAFSDIFNRWYIARTAQGRRKAEIERKRKKIKEIMIHIHTYRMERGKVLETVVVNRNDWKDIVGLIEEYLNIYMQNEAIYKLGLTDAFAVQRMRNPIKYYLTDDNKFVEIAN
eukprot:505054_1